MKTETKTFEQTYRSYPFPALVDFGVALSRLIVRKRGGKPAA